VTGAEVLAFIDVLPPCVNFFFTSRVGIGDTEHKVRVEPLELDAAIGLFDSLARARQVDHLVGLPRKELEQIQEVVSRTPLHIRWFVECAAAGQSIETIVGHRGDLIQFCVQNVYRGLSPDAMDIAGALAQVDGPQSASDLRLMFASIAPDALREAIQQLLVRRLAAVARIEDQVEYLQATEALVTYLRTVGADLDDRHRFTVAVDARLRAEERLRVEQARTPLRVNVIGGADVHRGAALALRDALKLSKMREYDEALRSIDNIEQLEPEFWELHRVRGNVLGYASRIAAATRAFERAIELAPDDSETARMRYFYAEHLILNVRDAHAAAVQAGAAHRTLQRPESAMQLGRALAYDQQFPAAIEALRAAYATPDIKMALMACTLLVDTYRRWSEDQAGVLNSPEAALDTLVTAVDVGLGHGEGDPRLHRELYRCVNEALRIASRMAPTSRRDELLRATLRVVEVTPLINAGDARAHVIASARRLASTPSLSDDILVALEKLTSDDGAGPTITPASTPDDRPPTVSARNPDGAELTGKVRIWRADRGFGFVTSTAGHDYFFHFQDLDQRTDQVHLAADVAVTFTPVILNGKPRASVVRLSQDPDPEALRHRALTVLRIAGERCVAVDDRTGVRVVVGPRAFADQEAWSRLAEDTHLWADLQVSAPGGYAATGGTAELA